MELLILIVAFLSPAVLVRGEIRVTLNSGNFAGVWTVHNDSSSLKIEARVPGGIYSDLGLAQDFFYRQNDHEYRWVGYENWTYETTFELSDEILNKTAINLIFHGIDTVGDIYVNNELVQSVNNMFVRYVIPIKSIAKEQNTLEVRLKSPVLTAKELADASEYELLPSCPGPEAHGECHINMLRKMQSSFSWDWGPAAPSVGIWKSVEIEAYNYAVARSVVGSIRSESNDTWTIDTLCTFETATDDDSEWGTWYYGVTLAAQNGQRVAHAKQYSSNKLAGVFTFNKTFEIGKGITGTWWPNGYGDQPLYTLDCHFGTLNDFDNEESITATNFGLRTIELVQEEIQQGQDGLSFYLKVNDVPIFAKGANWIPGHILPELGYDERMLRRTLQSTKDANMNMIRVWGGGVYESDLFYNICDELGIMIWQDMMFAVSLYPNTKEYMDSVKVEIDQNVKRLFNHPSIAIWSGNNEIEGLITLIKQGIIQLNNTEQYVQDYLTLYKDTIKPIVEGYENIRSYVLSSPSNGEETLEEGGIAQNPLSPLYGDVHYYNYDNDPRNISLYPNTRFASEYGFQGMPSFKSISQVSVPEDWNLGSEFTQFRQHHGNGYTEMTKLMKYFLPLPEDNGSEEFYRTFIYYSQISQAISTKTESEKYRVDRSKLTVDNQGQTMGALYWQLNDVWQAPTWASIEFGGRWKMLHYYATKFFGPIIVVPQLNPDGRMPVYIVSDLLEDVTCKLKVSLYSWDNFNDVITFEYAGQVENSASYTAITLDVFNWMRLYGCSEKTCFVYFSLEGENLFSENFFYPTSFSEVTNLKPVNITVSVTRDETSSDILVNLVTDRIAPFVWLETDIEGIFSDNGFTLITETKELKFGNRGEAIDIDKFLDTLVVRSLLG